MLYLVLVKFIVFLVFFQLHIIMQLGVRFSTKKTSFTFQIQVILIKFAAGTDFLGGVRGGAHPPRNDLHPPKAFGTPANYIYFDLIVSYLIILTTKFVKLPILWSQISPCRPRKQILLNFFLGLSGRCHHAPAKASSSTPPPPPDIYPPPRTRI